MGSACTSGRDRQVELVVSPPETNGNEENKKEASISSSECSTLRVFTDVQNSLGYRINRATEMRRLFRLSSQREFVSIAGFTRLLRKGISDPGIREHFYQHYDKDRNNQIDFVEFVTLLTSIVAIEKNFDSADKDKSNYISNNELQSVLSNLGISEDGKIPDLIMEMFDTNNDKVLDYEEFVVMFIFLKELVKVYNEYVENESIAAKRLCKLLDDHRKEESVAKHINKLRSEGRVVKLEDFLSEIAVHKFKPKNRKKAHYNKHWHPEQKDLDPSSDASWQDDTFDPDNAKILPHGLQGNGQVLWRRPKEIHPDSDLFVDGIAESDVIQGTLSDCWFLGALTLVANGLQKGITDLFIKMDYARGYYRCRFFKDGQWQTVDIDDRLPCFRAKNVYELYFGSCLDKSEFWVPILEKAYAKLHGSYDALDHGDTCEALKDLTGSATKEIKIKNDTELFDKQWNEILSLAQEKCLMGCAITGTDLSAEATSKGLYTDHTYAILKCEEVDGVRFLLIRNPWGMKEWNGDWSDGSLKWDDNWKKKPFVQGYQFDDNDGKFFMCFEDFAKYFNHLCVARTSFGAAQHVMNGEWNADTGKGCHLNPYWYLNPRYVITTHEPNTAVIVNLSQFDLRKSFSLNSTKIKDQGDFERIGLYMLKTGDSGIVTMQLQMEKQSVFINNRDTSLECTIEKPATYVLQPCTYDPLGDTLSYTLSVYSKFRVDMKEIRTSKSHKVDGKWPEGFKSTNSGKSINGPHYKVQCSQACNIDILLVPKQKMKIGIKVSQLKKELISEIANERESEQPSICVSMSAAKKGEYIIEPLALEPAKSPTEFELVVFSDHVEVAQYFTPTNSRDQCIVCLV